MYIVSREMIWRRGFEFELTWIIVSMKNLSWCFFPSLGWLSPSWLRISLESKLFEIVKWLGYMKQMTLDDWVSASGESWLLSIWLITSIAPAARLLFHSFWMALRKRVRSWSSILYTGDLLVETLASGLEHANATVHHRSGRGSSWCWDRFVQLLSVASCKDGSLSNVPISSITQFVTCLNERSPHHYFSGSPVHY